MDTNSPILISPPGVSDMQLAFCDPKHPNNLFMVTYYLDILEDWLATNPFSEPDTEVPDNSVIQLVYELLLEKLDPDDPENYISMRYLKRNSNIYILCNHRLVCRLLMLGYEFDINLDIEKENRLDLEE